MNVYVIGSSPLGPVKIGHGSQPGKRLSQFQTGNPNSLKLFHSESVGYLARVVEQEAHRLLVTKRLQLGGTEWFSVTAEEAIMVIRGVARAMDVVFDSSMSLHDLNWKASSEWRRSYSDYEHECSDGEAEQDNNLEDVDGPCGLRLLAESIATRASFRPRFLDFLESHAEGVLYAWALERLGARLRRDDRIQPYYEAEKFIDDNFSRGILQFYEVRGPAIRCLEWATSRTLGPAEISTIKMIWKNFVEMNNELISQNNGSTLLKRSYPQKASAEEVFVSVLRDNNGQKQSDKVMLHSGMFRMVLVPTIPTKLLSDKSDMTSSGGSYVAPDPVLETLEGVECTGFLSCWLAPEVWLGPPIRSWLREAPQTRDAQFSAFLDNPTAFFPSPHYCEDPEKSFVKVVCMPRVDEEGHPQ
jgi:hypothetical protein